MENTHAAGLTTSLVNHAAAYARRILFKTTQRGIKTRKFRGIKLSFLPHHEHLQSNQPTIIPTITMANPTILEPVNAGAPAPEQYEPVNEGPSLSRPLRGTSACTVQ